MEIKQEIEKFSAEEDKQVLLDLFTQYHWESDWRFVTTCRKERYGKLSYEVKRIWVPTKAGRIIYWHKKLIELLKRAADTLEYSHDVDHFSPLAAEIRVFLAKLPE